MIKHERLNVLRYMYVNITLNYLISYAYKGSKYKMESDTCDSSSENLLTSAGDSCLSEYRLLFLRWSSVSPECSSMP